MTEAQTKAMIEQLERSQILVKRHGVSYFYMILGIDDSDDLYAFLIRQAYLASTGE